MVDSTSSGVQRHRFGRLPRDPGEALAIGSEVTVQQMQFESEYTQDTAYTLSRRPTHLTSTEVPPARHAPAKGAKIARTIKTTSATTDTGDDARWPVGSHDAGSERPSIIFDGSYSSDL
jgi:hypothetical protein